MEKIVSRYLCRVECPVCSRSLAMCRSLSRCLSERLADYNRLGISGSCPICKTGDSGEEHDEIYECFQFFRTLARHLSDGRPEVERHIGRFDDGDNVWIVTSVLSGLIMNEETPTASISPAGPPCPVCKKGRECEGVGTCMEKLVDKTYRRKGQVICPLCGLALVPARRFAAHAGCCLARWEKGHN